MNTTSLRDCVKMCLRTDGCLAVNVVKDNKVMVCVLTAGLSSDKDMVPDEGVDLYVFSKYQRV